MKTIETVQTVQRSKSWKKWFRAEHIPLWLMLLPSIVYLVMFCYAPMVGVILAFKKYHVGKGIFGSPWVGFKNFEFLFASSDAWVITRNTVVYSVITMFLNKALSVVLAIILNEVRPKRLTKVFQTIFMMPHFLSWVIIAMIVGAFLSKEKGLVNQILIAMGKDPVAWYQNIQFWPPFIIFLQMWKGVGYGTVLYLATISGISQDYYEAAMLDGASRFQLARYITIPHLSTVISITIIMGMSSIFRSDIGLFYTVPQNSGALYPVTQTLDTYIYLGLQHGGNIGMNAAAGLYQTVVGFLLVLLTNWIVSKINPENSMF